MVGGEREPDIRQPHFLVELVEADVGADAGLQPGFDTQGDDAVDFGVEHLTRWERVAVVTDVEWIRLAVNLFRFLVPGGVKVFPTAQAAEARRWVAA